MFVADDGENSIVVVPGANGKMDRAVVDQHAELIRSAGMVLCQLEIPMDTSELHARPLRAKAQACR
jgi:ribokinase